MKTIIGKCSSKKVTVRATFDAGAYSEYNKDWKSGTAHLMEHMIFQGTNDMDNKELTRQLATLGADWNGLTWHDKVSFFVTVPVENAIEASKLLQAMLFNRKFDEESFNKEKLVVLEEERGTRDDVEHNIIEKLDSFLCNGPLASSIIGTEKSIKSITFEDIKNYHRYFYKPQNLLLTITGPEDTEFDNIIEIFGKDTGKFRKFKREKNKFTSSKYKKISDNRVSQARIFITYKAYPFQHKNALILSFIDKFLGDDMDSRLFQIVRQKYGLCYNISTSTSFYNDIGWYIVMIKTSHNAIRKVLMLVNREMERMIKDGPTKEEMIRAKNKYFSEIYGIIETSYGLNSMLSTRGFNNIPDIQVSLDRIRNMNIKDVRDVCSQILLPKNKQLFTYVPENTHEL